MNIKARRLLYFFFIFLFFAITPLVSMFAAGYKFNLNNFSFEKTGMFVLDSLPEGAVIHINGLPQLKNSQNFISSFFMNNYADNMIKTPAKIKNILPGEYTVTLRLDGYHDWEKKLKIIPGNSTFAENVVLFKKNSPNLIEKSSPRNISLSPDKKLLAVIEEKELKIIKQTDGIMQQKMAIATTTTAYYPIIWSENSQKILFDNQLYNINMQSLKRLDSLSGKDGFNLKWSDDDNNEIYYQTKKNLHKIISEQKATTTIIESKSDIIDYLQVKNFIFTIENDTDAITVKAYTPDGKRVIRNIEIPPCKKYVINDYNNDLLSISNQEDMNTLLIDLKNMLNPLSDILKNSKHTDWINEKILLYYDDYEIWLYDFNAHKQTLLTRFSKQIDSIQWHPDYNYLFIAAYDGIYTLELDNREKRNITQLSAIENPKFLQINKDGTMLDFYAEIENLSGIFILEI
jgi:WD40 repeat protein